MINYLDFKKKKLDLNVFMIKNNVPTRFGPQIRPVLNVFNTDISNGLIKFDEKTVNALVKWEQNHKKSKKKEKVLEQELEREVAQKTKRKFDLASDK